MSVDFNDKEGVLSGWRRLSRETVCKTPVLDLVMERFRSLRTGAEGDFYRLECFNWVNVIAETPDGQIVMIRQFRHGVAAHELEIPGGCIDENLDADPVAAGERELFEETGFRGDKGVLIGSVHPNPALQNNTCHTVLVRNARKVSAQELEATEDIEAFLMPYDKVRDVVEQGGVRHGLVLNAFYFYDIFKHKETKERTGMR